MNTGKIKQGIMFNTELTHDTRDFAKQNQTCIGMYCPTEASIWMCMTLLVLDFESNATIRHFDKSLASTQYLRAVFSMLSLGLGF